MKKITILLLFFTFCLAASGCDGKKEPEEQKTIRVLYADWAGTFAMTHLAKYILEERMGYKIYLTPGDVNTIYVSLARGEYDFFMGAWLPKTHKRYYYHYDSKLDNLGPNYHGAKTGLAVPDYVTINDITELGPNSGNFGGKIVGIETGAGIINNTSEAQRVYGFNLNIETNNEKTMLDKLDEAIKRNEWIVITGWRPHWMFSRYNLKFLDDPKKIFGEIETINTISRKGLRKSNPVLYKFLKNFSLNNEQMESLLEDFHYLPGNPTQAAKNWASKNNDVVNSWIPED